LVVSDSGSNEATVSPAPELSKPDVGVLPAESPVDGDANGVPAETQKGSKDANRKNRERKASKKAGSQPAEKGKKLDALSQPPEHTVSLLQVKANADYSRYDSTVEPYGLKGGLSAEGVPREIVFYVSAWKARESGKATLPNLAGRNVLMRIQAPPDQAKKLLKGGAYHVVVKVLVQGETGMLVIEQVK
jgi:hypothetical protein